MQARYQAAPRPDGTPSLSVGHGDDKHNCGSDVSPALPLLAFPKSGGSNEIQEPHARTVHIRQFVHFRRSEPPSAELTAEQPSRSPIPEQGSEQPCSQRHHQPGNQTRNTKDVDRTLQSSSRSLPLSMKLPMLIPLLPMSSRRLIMYPFAMSIASSDGMPASTSFL